VYNVQVIQDNLQKIEPLSFSFNGEGNEKIHALKWLPSPENIKAILIINHGMAEHISRYDSFASFMAEKGFAVYGEDHRGHGDTAGSVDNLGYFADEKGWMKVIGDIRTLYLLALDEQKNLPVFMLGHSMGSFLTRHYLSLYGSEITAAVISGTGFQSSLLLSIAKILSTLESAVKGKRHRSKMLDTLSFGSNNKSFDFDGAHGFEWLSRDSDQTRKYVEDPYCGFICTSGFFSDLADGLKIINKKSCYAATPDNLPLLLYSGKDDPVGNFGKVVESVASSYRKNGNNEITVMLKDDMRHECLDELGCEDCYQEIYKWMTARLSG
jgi:alpha-beta hydrolase superfamily lysophospholipase